MIGHKHSGGLQRHKRVRRGLCSLLATAVFGGQLQVYADVIGDGSAHSSEGYRAGNGVEVVDINAPNAAGVSRNQYQRFNVERSGLVLNNSGKIGQSQLAGYIDANAKLVGGAAASLILNEVTSTQSSQLDGAIEISGPRSDLIVANPNGLFCDGCGFINTGRASLVAGRVSFDGDSGRVSSFLTQGGEIKLSGRPLDARDTQQTDLIARALRIDSDIWAQSLNLVSGGKAVNYPDLGIRSIHTDGQGPAVGIDVSALGGMYANRIRLIATEQGVGVNLQGTLAASEQELHIDSAGWLSVGGRAHGENALSLTAKTLDVSGELSSAGDSRLHSTEQLQLSGRYNAFGDVVLEGASVAVSGQLQTRGNLLVSAQHGATVDGGLAAAGELKLQVIDGSAELGGGTLEAGKALDLHVTGELGAVDAKLVGVDRVTVDAAALSAAGTQWQSGGELSLLARSGGIDLRNARIDSAGTLRIDAEHGRLDLRGVGDRRASALTLEGTGVRAGQLDFNAQSIDLSQSLVYTRAVQGQNRLSAQTLHTREGKLAVQGALVLDVRELHNTLGKITATGHVAANARAIHQGGGELLGGGNIDLRTEQLFGLGRVIAAEQLALQLDGDYHHTDGQVMRGIAGTHFEVSGTFSIDAALENLNALTIKADTADIRAAARLNAAELSIEARAATNAGEIDADTVHLKGGRFTNTGSVVGRELTADLAHLSNRGVNALLAGVDSVRLWVAQRFDNTDQASLYSAGSLEIGAKDNGELALLENRSASIESEGAMTLRVGQLHNTREVSVAEGAESSREKTTVEYPGYSATRPKCHYEEGSQVCSGVETYQVQDLYTATVAADRVLEHDPVAKTARLSVYVGKVVSETKEVCSGGGESGTECTTVPTAYRDVYRTDEVALYESHALENGEHTFSYYRELDLENQFHPDQALEPVSLETYWGQNKSHREIERKETTTRVEQSVSSRDAPAKIVANTDLTISVGESVKNTNALISAGARLVINASQTASGNVSNAKLDNSGTEILATESTRTVSQMYHKDGCGIGESDCGTSILPYTWPEIRTTQTVIGAEPARVIAGDAAALSLQSVSNAQINPASAPVIDAASGAGERPAFSLSLPDTALFQITTQPQRGYVVESNPRFTQYSNFISGAYMLERLGLQPEQTMKRVGDGFYEQRLLGEQLLAERGFSASQQQRNQLYSTLMDNAVAQHQSLGLTVGEALTPSQIESLEDDIVWLVETELQLPDGRRVRVLAPRLYTAPANRLALTTTGALIYASNAVTIESETLDNSGAIRSGGIVAMESGTLENSGEIGGNRLTDLAVEGALSNHSGQIGGGDVRIDAGNLVNETRVYSQSYRNADGSNSAHNELLGRQASIGGSGDTSIHSRGDILDRGGALTAGGDLNVSAAGDIDLQAQRLESGSRVESRGDYQEQSQTRHQSTQLQSGGDLSISAGGQLSAQALQAQSGGDLQLSGAEGVQLTQAYNSQSTEAHGQGKGYRYDKTDTARQGQGVQLQSGGALSVQAGSAEQSNAQLSITGGTLSAEGQMRLSASGDVDLQAGSSENTRDHDSWSKSRRGLNRSSQSSSEESHEQSKTALTLLAGELAIESGKDLALSGVDAAVEGGIALQAGGDVLLSGAATSGSSDTRYKKRQSGLSLSGGTLSAGTSKSQGTGQSTYTDVVGNTLLSEAGGLDISAGGRAQLNDTDIRTQQDITVDASAISAQSTARTQTGAQWQKQETLSIGLGIGGKKQQILDTASQTQQGLAHSENASDSRLQALRQYQTVKQSTEAIKDIASGSNVPGPTVTLSASKSESSSTQSSQDHKALNWQSGEGDLNLKANAGDIRLTGVQATAANANLEASGDISISAAQNSQNSSSENDSQGLSLSYNFATQRVGGSAQLSEGSTEQQSTTHTLSSISTSGKTTISSGGDLSLTGASIEAERIEANIGGELKIESVQDTASYGQSQRGAGFSVPTDGKTSASGNLNKSDTDASYTAVQAQSGLFAGAEGFDITVEQDTTLTGAVIASTASPENNKLSTADIHTEDLTNSREEQSGGLSVGVSNTGPSISPSLGTKDKDSSQTQSAIALGSIELTGTQSEAQKAETLKALNRATEAAHESLANTFNAQETAERLELATGVGKLTFDAIGDLYQAKENLEALREKTEASPDFSEAEKADKLAAIDAELEKHQNLPPKALAHAVGAALVANMAGSNVATAAIGNGLQEQLNQTLLANSELTDNQRELLSVAIGGAVGGQNTAAITLLAEQNNRQLHKNEIDFIDAKAKDYAAKRGISEAQAKKELLRGALYSVDEHWQDTYTDFKPEEIERYQAAAAYLSEQAQGESFTNEHGQQQQAFTVTTEQFENERLHLNQSMNSATFQSNAGLSGGEKGPVNQLMGPVSSTVGAAVGLVTGSAEAVVEAAEGVATAFDPETYEQLGELAELAKEDPERFAELMAEAGLEGAEQTIADLNEYADLSDLYEMQGRNAEQGEHVASGAVRAAGGLAIPLGKLKALAQVAKAAKAREVGGGKSSPELSEASKEESPDGGIESAAHGAAVVPSPKGVADNVSSAVRGSKGPEGSGGAPAGGAGSSGEGGVDSAGNGGSIGPEAFPPVRTGEYQPLPRPTSTTPSNTILGDLDDLGRPSGVTATIKAVNLGTGSAASSSIRPPGFEGQPANHARGHLLANSLGGAGNDAKNLVTLFQMNANHPNMSSFERQVANAVKNGETVNFRVVPVYTGSNAIPTGVTLTAKGSDGFSLDVSIPNVSGVK